MKKKIMNILLTGTHGFIGQHVAKKLLENGDSVTGVMRKNNIENTNYNYKIIEHDLRNTLEFSEKYDVVIHIAGRIRGNKIEDFIEDNIEATRKLLYESKKNKVKKFIYMSTNSIYGISDTKVNEESDKTNLDFYGLTKYICELLLSESSIPSKYCIRLPRVLGKNIDFSYQWLPYTAYNMLHNQEVVYHSPDKLYNNLIHIDSLTEFILQIINSDNNNEYNVIGLGTKNPLKVSEVLSSLKKELYSKSKLIERKDIDKKTCNLIDITKAISYGYKPYSTEETIRRFSRDIK